MVETRNWHWIAWALYAPELGALEGRQTERNGIAKQRDLIKEKNLVGMYNTRRVWASMEASDEDNAIIIATSL